MDTGGTALALSAVVSLSMATPVWAEKNGVVTGVTGNDPNSNVGVSNNAENYNHEDETSSTGESIGNDKTVLVSANVPASYTVSIPKNIVLKQTQSSTGVLSKIVETDTSFQVTDVNIGEDQDLSISIANSNSKITLNNKKGGNSSTSKMCSAELIPDNTNMKLSNESLTTNGGKKQWIGPTDETVRISPDSDIYAGNWYGLLTFSVNLSTEADTGTLTHNSYTYNDFSPYN